MMKRDEGQSNGAIVWTIRALAGVALGLSAYLGWQSMVGQGPAGCGPGSDCDAVLASRWSTWLGVPVGVMGGGVYLAILVVMSLGRRRRWEMATPLAALAGGAGLWFAGVQVASVGRVCPYCMAVHACGVVIGGLVLWRSPRRAGAVLGLVGVGVMVGGQLAFPGAAKMAVSIGGGDGVGSTRPTTAGAATTTTATTVPAGGSLVRLRVEGQTVELDRREFPMIGPADASHVVAVMSDYTCPQCRSFHPYLDHAVARYPGQLAVIVLPVPLNGRCNPRIRQTKPMHEYACEVARIALSVWRADAGAFGRMDRWLFEPATPRTPNEARAMAIALVGEAGLRRGEADPLVERVIVRSVGLYDQANGGTVPKLIMPTDLKGNLTSEAAFFAMLERELGLTAPGK